MRASKRVKRELTYRAIRTVAWFASLLPRRMALVAGSILGMAGYGLMGRARSLALEHLRAAYPSSSRAWRQRVALRCFVNLVWNAVDLLHFSRRDTGALSAACEVAGYARLERALRSGAGVICISAHIGNWELIAVRMAQLGFKVAVVARRLYYPRLDQWVNSL